MDMDWIQGEVTDGDWRTQLQPEARQRIVNEIMETLKRHLHFSGQEGLLELKKIAVRFEGEIYTAATCQSDYLSKMLTMETKSQNPMSNSLQSDAESNNRNPQDPASLDSSSQTGNASGRDWQEEIYLKIKSMNEMYFPELSETYQQLAAKLQLYDSHALPQPPKNDQLEKLRFLVLLFERLILFLRTNKNDIQPNYKEKVLGIEKQIVNILNSKRLRKPLQQGQLGQAHMHAMQQSQQRQISQVHSSDSQINSQVQAMNAQSSAVTNMQRNSSVSNLQNMMDMLQLVSNIDPGQGNAI